ncbi:MAG: hypothetical protein ABI406_00860 [Ktedonobacteraceae bacterium]
MQCVYCGTPLPTGVPFCRNCGRSTSPATPYNTPQQNASNTSNETAPHMNFGPPQETSSVSPDAAPPSSPFQPYQPLPPQSNQQPHMIFGSGSQQVYPQPGVPPLQESHPSFPQYPQYPQQPPTAFGPGPGYPQAGAPPQQLQSGTFGQEQLYPTRNMPQQQQQQEMYPQGYFAQPGSVPQQQRRRSGLSTGVIVLLIVLVIAIIGGGGILLYATVLQPSSRHAQTNTISTTQTKTPQVQATAPITTTSPQDLYTQVMSRTPTLNDPLTGQDANNWQNLSSLSSCTFTAGVLHLSGSAGSCVGESTNFSDFAYQVKMTIIKGDLGGVAFRVDAVNRKLYFFTINPDGLYIVAFIGGGSTSSGNQKILAAASSSAITTGLNQQNTLTVIARSSNINIYINKQYITTLTDSSSTIGAIGMLGGSSTSGSSDVTFSDAQVWTL